MPTIICLFLSSALLGNYELSSISHVTMSPSRQNNLVSMYSSVALSKSSYNVISAFCTEDNIPQCISYINQVLQNFVYNCNKSITNDDNDISPLLFTGACLTRPLFHMYRGHLTRGSRPEHSASSERRVRSATDSQTKYVHFRRAGERTVEKIQHLGPHANEQFQIEGMYDCRFWCYFLAQF